jgi:hypothetical protein
MLAITTQPNPLDITVECGVKIGETAMLFGDAQVVFGPDGTMMSLVGNVGGGVHLDGWNMDNVDRDDPGDPRAGDGGW